MKKMDIKVDELLEGTRFLKQEIRYLSNGQDARESCSVRQ